MKYTVSDIRASETKKLDVSQFFPVKEDEKVVVTIRHLPMGKRNEVISLMMMGQRVDTAGESMEIRNADWYLQAREIELLYGVVLDDDFPFEKWDKQIIAEIDERAPEFIQFLQDEIQDFNRPLAEKKNE